MKKRLLSTVFLFVILLCLLPTNALAASTTTWVEITQTGQVVDSITFQGKTINAIYAPYMTFGSVTYEDGTIGYYYNGHQTYCCAAFVKRFYQEVYGVSVTNLLVGGTPTSTSASFQKTTTPVVGDIVSFSNSQGKYGSHWAIVKTVNSDETVTLIEQNHWKEYAPNRVHAAVGYTISITDSAYQFYHMSNASSSSSSPSSSSAITNLSYATVTTSSAQSITQTSAVLYGSAKSTGAKMTSCGIELGTSESNMTKLGSDTISTYSTSMWYSTSKYGRTLTPNTTYYYRAYAIVGNVTYYGKTCSFTTPPSTEQTASISLNKSSLSMQDNVCIQLTATTTPSGQSVTWTSSNPSVATVDSNGGVTGRKAGTATITASITNGGKTYTASCQVTVTATSSVTYTVSGASSITQTTARVDASCTYTGTRPTTVGLYLGTSKTNLSYYGSDTLVSTATNNPVSVWYNLKNLTAGTTYYYQFYAVVNGTTYTSDIYFFTTLTQTTSNTRTGVVSGSNGALAINDSPAASPAYSNQIGMIPEGGTCTVYPDKQSGNWYYVSYNGVSGYAYSKYITLN